MAWSMIPPVISYWRCGSSVFRSNERSITSVLLAACAARRGRAVDGAGGRRHRRGQGRDGEHAGRHGRAPDGNAGSVHVALSPSYGSDGLQLGPCRVPAAAACCEARGVVDAQEGVEFAVNRQCCHAAADCRGQHEAVAGEAGGDEGARRARERRRRSAGGPGSRRSRR